MAMDNKRGGQHSQDEQILSEIRDALIELKLQAANLTSSSGKYQEIQHALLISGLNDALSLSQNSSPIGRGRCAINVGHVAASFAESFGERVGDRYARRVCIVVDDTLPIVIGNPAELVATLDCLVRGVLTQSSDSKLQISITPLQKPVPSDAKQCSVKFGILSSQVFQVNTAIRAGLKLARRVGIEATLLTNEEGAFGLQLVFASPVPARALAMPFLPEPFSFITSDPSVQNSLEEIAGFHRVSSVRCKEISRKLARGARVLFDCGELPDLTVRHLKRAHVPKDALLLLRDRSTPKMIELAEAGFRNFINLPFVSTSFFRGLDSSDAFQHEGQSSRSGGVIGRALVVDDAASARATVRAMLEGLGYEVIEGSDGLDLVKYTGNGEKFDLIFCDLMMPHLDGISAIKHLRALEAKGSRVPAVLMTTYSEVAAEEKAIFAGFDVVLQKPLHSKDLAEAVSRLSER